VRIAGAAAADLLSGLSGQRCFANLPADGDVEECEESGEGIQKFGCAAEKTPSQVGPTSAGTEERRSLSEG